MSKKVSSHFDEFKQVKNLVVIALGKSKNLVVILLTLNKKKVEGSFSISTCLDPQT